METLFLSVLNRSFTAIFVIGAVLLLRLALCRAPKIFAYALWLVVFARLVCPFSLESPWSLLPVQPRPLSEALLYTGQPKIDSGIPALDRAVNASLPAPDQGASADPLQVLLAAGAFLWAAGLVVLLLYSALSLRRLRRSLSDAQLRADTVWVSPRLCSPFVLGLIKPRIYLPGNLPPEEERYLLLHEQIHIRRLDYLVKPVAFGIACIHWFNPLVWAAFFLMARDMEMACDERTLRELGGSIKKDYARSLLSMAQSGHPLGGTPLAFGEGAVGGRIRNVLRFQRPPVWVWAAALCVLLAAAAGLLPDPAARPTLRWAQTLTADQVARVEMVETYSSQGKQYRLFSQEEIPQFVSLVRASRGRYISQPESLAGGGYSFLITTVDGQRHWVQNSGNVYLYIDGDAYAAPYSWLSQWDYEGKEPIPDSFSAAEEEEAAQRQRRMLEALAATVRYNKNGGKLSFTIPRDLGVHPFVLHISGRFLLTDGSGMSWHAFEEESEQRSWTPGKTYETHIDLDGTDSTGFIFTLTDRDPDTAIDLQIDAQGVLSRVAGEAE